MGKRRLPPADTELARRLQQWQETKGLTTKAAAAILGVSPVAYRRWIFAGITPWTRYLPALRRELGEDIPENWVGLPPACQRKPPEHHARKEREKRERKKQRGNQTQQTYERTTRRECQRYPIVSEANLCDGPEVEAEELPQPTGKSWRFA